MDVWLSACKKRGKCSYCSEYVEHGEPEIFGRLWRKYITEGGESRGWTLKLRWHAQRARDGQCCWLVQALERLSKAPPVENRGRKRLVLPKEMKDQRLALLRKRARTIQLIKEEMEKPELDRSIDIVIRHGAMLEELKGKILPLGGVPSSWE